MDPCNKYSVIKNLKCMQRIHLFNQLGVLSLKQNKTTTQSNFFGFLLIGKKSLTLVLCFSSENIFISPKLIDI